MISIKKRLLSFALIALCFAGIFRTAQDTYTSEADDGAVPVADTADPKTTLIIWYADEMLGDYLEREAVAFGQASDDVRVLPVQVSGLNFFETLGEASVKNIDFPDLYITTHDNLEKAALSGLAGTVDHPEDFLRGDNYPQSALSAVTWHGDAVAYPFYGETTALLYNRTYLEDEAKQRAEEAGEPVPDGDELDELVADMLPDTLTELLDFAGHYNAPEEVESVFSFDVGDLFTDFFFAGDAINVGGENGDDKSVVDVYNVNSLTCLDIYQQLGQFFSTSADETDGEKVLADFIAGKTVFTISTTDAVRKLAEAMESDECSYEFGAVPLFDLTDDIETRALSVTSCVVVNGFSEHQEQANRFARFLTEEGAQDMYERTGKMPARRRASYGENEIISDMMTAYFRDYETSVPMPKMIETSNYWIRLEIAFADIWGGAGVNDTMRGVAGQLMSQITGSATMPDRIDDPPRILLSQDIPEDSAE